MWHALAVGFIVALSYLPSEPRPPRVEKRPIALRPMNARQWEKNRGRRPEERPTGQVVDVAPGNLQRPKESKYLAETDNTVEKQTRAKEMTNKWRKAAPKTVAAPSPVSLASRFEHLDRDDGAKTRPGPLLTPTPTPDVPSDAPTEATGGAAPNDALDEETGEGTYLNTREWKFASFMNRVKQAVSAKWDPNGRLKEKEPQRQLLAPRTTVLFVALRPDGYIADVFVARSCGIDQLDREAVAAFERAAPFPNVPEALIENGYVRFQFGFTLTPNDRGFMPVMSPQRM
ncbi:MAG: TonB family protein [Myxococcaceae bacterium]|nr:TonB family protein [Myxococcaceae bacterium]